MGKYLKRNIQPVIQADNFTVCQKLTQIVSINQLYFNLKTFFFKKNDEIRLHFVLEWLKKVKMRLFGLEGRSLVGSLWKLSSIGQRPETEWWNWQYLWEVLYCQKPYVRSGQNMARATRESHLINALHSRPTSVFGVISQLGYFSYIHRVSLIGLESTIFAI